MIVEETNSPSTFIFSFKFCIYKVSEICSGSSGSAVAGASEGTTPCMASDAGGAVTSSMVPTRCGLGLLVTLG